MSTLPFNANLIFAFGLAMLGLVIGSFLNVVIARVPADQSIVRPRSRCPKCEHALPWYENIPVFSWLFLRGKCSACGAPISWRYPLVELITALLYLACLQRFDWSWELASALMLVTLLVPLTFIDLEHWLLPFSLTLPGIALGVALSVPMGLERLRDSLLGAAAGFFGFWAMEWVGRKVFRKEALGGGDKYLLALIGAFLTYKPLLGVVFLASLQGAIVGLALLLLVGRAGPAPADGSKASAPTGSEPNQPAESMQHRTSESTPPGQPLRHPGSEPVSAAEPAQYQASESIAPAEPTQRPAAEPPPPAGPRPQPPVDGLDQEEDWQPGPTNIPFGPWLSLAALEVMLLQPWLAEAVPWRAVQLLLGAS